MSKAQSRGNNISRGSRELALFKELRHSLDGVEINKRNEEMHLEK